MAEISKSDDAKTKKEEDKGEHAVNKHIFVWVGNFLFGALGIDRFLRGQIGLGVLKLALNTIGWFTIIGGLAGSLWVFIDWVISVVKAYGSGYSRDENITFDANGNYLK